MQIKRFKRFLKSNTEHLLKIKISNSRFLGLKSKDQFLGKYMKVSNKIIFLSIKKVLIAFGLILTVSNSTFAQELSDTEIQSLFEGNTVAGRYTDGAPFSEFHHVDGHAYGHNRGIANTDACWIVQPGKVCYYYGPPERRLSFCFTVTKTAESYILINAPPNNNQGRINAIAKVEKGNPEKLGGNGKPWTCDGLLSGLTRPEMKIISLWAKIKLNSKSKPYTALAQSAPQNTTSAKIPQKAPLGAIPRIPHIMTFKDSNVNLEKGQLSNAEKRLPPGQIPRPSNLLANPLLIERPSSADVPRNSGIELHQKNSNKILINSNSKHKMLPVKNFQHPQPIFASSPKNSPRLNKTGQNTIPIQLKLPTNNPSTLKTLDKKNDNNARIEASNSVKPLTVIQRKICAAGKSTC